jgi:hypothetical protein
MLMKKSLCIIFLWSFGLTQIMGQATTEMPAKPTHSISLGVGFSHTAMKITTISPLILKGVGVPLHLTYRRENTVSKHFVQLLFRQQTSKSPFGFDFTEQGGHLIYGYLRKVKSGDKLGVYLGGELQIQGVNGLTKKGYNSEVFLVLNGLNISSLVDYRLGKHFFEAQIALTALAYNRRPDTNLGRNFGKTAEDGVGLFTDARFEYPPQYLNTSLRLSYLPVLTAKHLQWRLDYWGSFYRFNPQQKYAVLQHQLMTSLTYKF